MRQCAFLSMDSLEDFECYDNLLYAPFKEIGWQVTPVPWRRKDIDWNFYEVVIIRSPWDYQDDPELFIEVLEKIDASSALLANPLEIVTWNINKKYLQELSSKGVQIVPSLFEHTFKKELGLSYFETFDCDEIIIKPVVSANADDTFRLGPTDQRMDMLENIFNNRDFLVQPFIEAIISEGEYSLFYFGGHYSHCILKTPKQDDFRVQEEHGGQLRSIDPEPQLLELANATMATLSPQPLYGRIDFVRQGDSFLVMELELIEPSLYFNMDSLSPTKFTMAFSEWMEK